VNEIDLERTARAISRPWCRCRDRQGGGPRTRRAGESPWTPAVGCVNRVSRRGDGGPEPAGFRQCRGLPGWVLPAVSPRTRWTSSGTCS